MYYNNSGFIDLHLTLILAKFIYLQFKFLDSINFSLSLIHCPAKFYNFITSLRER